MSGNSLRCSKEDYRRSLKYWEKIIFVFLILADQKMCHVSIANIVIGFTWLTLIPLEMANLTEKLRSSDLGKDLHLNLSGHLELLEVKFDGKSLEPGHKFSKDQAIKKKFVSLSKMKRKIFSKQNDLNTFNNKNFVFCFAVK